MGFIAANVSRHARPGATRRGWTTLPADRPAIIVADGLLSFLDADTATRLLRTTWARLSTWVLRYSF